MAAEATQAVAARIVAAKMLAAEGCADRVTTPIFPRKVQFSCTWAEAGRVKLNS
jgi:hypothetical protein